MSSETIVVYIILLLFFFGMGMGASVLINDISMWFSQMRGKADSPKISRSLGYHSARGSIFGIVTIIAFTILFPPFRQLFTGSNNATSELVVDDGYNQSINTASSTISPSFAGGAILLVVTIVICIILWIAIVLTVSVLARRNGSTEPTPSIDNGDVNIGAFFGIMVFAVILFFHRGDLRTFLSGISNDNPVLNIIPEILSRGKQVGGSDQNEFSAQSGSIDPAFGAAESQNRSNSDAEIRSIDPAFSGTSIQGGRELSTGSSVEARLDVTGLTESYDGFFTTTIYVEITNNGASRQRNPILRCWQLGQNGTTIKQNDETIYQDVSPSETISSSFNILRDDQTADIQCQVVDAAGF
ncbi:hypothetical protein [Brevundimonas sp. DC300-4]|uniref:hypothetical protein n=1 Tax=Brevundimonas sp. DC300-4 TaxID=2804594 RepID=UPI003CE75E7C